MQTFLNFIYEKMDSDTGNPDYILHNNKEYSFTSEYATPFIYNVSTNTVIFGTNGKTHNDILFSLKQDEFKKYNLFYRNKPVLYVDYLSSGKLEKQNKCGRIWVIPNNISKHRKYDVYIAWWNELDKQSFRKFNDTIVNEYNKKYRNNIESYIGVGNNGEFILVEPNGNEIKILKQDKTRKTDIEILKCIHLASRKEKAEFFKPWKASVAAHREKELQMLGIRDGTYAKRNDKFAKHIVYDETTGKYKSVYGTKIGDSLIMKTITNYITEHIINKHLTKNSKNVNDIEEYENACKDALGNNQDIIKRFTALMDDINRTEHFDIEDIPEELHNDAEAAGDYVGFTDYLEDATREDDWHYNAYYNTLDMLRGSHDNKISKINELAFLWLKAYGVK